MIDLRSDTLTRPTPGMLAVMGSAEVGDDVYGEDPTVNAFERDVAEMFGAEAGLYCVTGSLSNLLGIWLSTEPGTEVLCDSGAHIVRAELGAHAMLHGVTTRTWTSDNGIVDAAAVERLVAPDAGPFLVRTSALELENTHNFGGGTIQPLETIVAIRDVANAAGLRMHLDGARLWNAHVATGVELAEYGRHFDTMSVCFSKGLGAPVGSMLLGPADDIARARIQRKRLGAGWRQAGVLAAAARFAVEHQLERLADDHAAAATLADAIRAHVPSAVGEVATNIVVIDTGDKLAADVALAASERGVRVSPLGTRILRVVTHLDVTAEQCEAAGRVLGELLAG